VNGAYTDNSDCGFIDFDIRDLDALVHYGIVHVSVLSYSQAQTEGILINNERPVVIISCDSKEEKAICVLLQSRNRRNVKQDSEASVGMAIQNNPCPRRICDNPIARKKYFQNIAHFPRASARAIFRSHHCIFATAGV
jgi:hypothetical protein